MSPNPMMRGFPPEMPRQVTLANWRLPPFNRWAFHHVNEIVPAATIPAEPRLAVELPRAPQAIGRIAFEGTDGEEQTVAGFLQQSCTDGIVVLQRGRLVHEWYDSGCTPAQPHIVFSVSKSLTAIAAGIAVDRDLLDPDAQVTQYVPEAEGFAYGDATVRHVLDMTVSIAEFDENDPANASFLLYRQATGWNPRGQESGPSDLRSFLVALGKGSQPHGHAFRYVSPNSDMLGWILERATGRRFADFFAEEVWQRIGAGRDGYVTVDRLGAPRTAGGVCVTTRDLALFGEMMRCRGVANGRQVVPGWWIDDIRGGGDPKAWARGNYAAFLPQGGYRSKWYILDRDRPAFCAIGIHGQWIYVDPEADLVIAKVSSQPEAQDEALDQAHIRAFRAIAERLG